MVERSTPTEEEVKSGRAEAVKTYIEQTKLLVSLASGFVLAPPAVLSIFRHPDGDALTNVPWNRFYWAEGFLISSILAGYLVLASIAGYQHIGNFNVHRTATRIFSIIQLLLYIAGIGFFVLMVRAAL